MDPDGPRSTPGAGRRSHAGPTLPTKTSASDEPFEGPRRFTSAAGSPGPFRPSGYPARALPGPGHSPRQASSTPAASVSPRPSRTPSTARPVL
jgi:hypothetical protein